MCLFLHFSTPSNPFFTTLSFLAWCGTGLSGWLGTLGPAHSALPYPPHFVPDSPNIRSCPAPLNTARLNGTPVIADPTIYSEPIYKRAKKPPQFFLPYIKKTIFLKRVFQTSNNVKVFH